MRRASATVRGDGNEPRFRSRRGVYALGFALFAGPVAWGIGFSAAYPFVTVACDARNSLPLHLIHALALLLTVGGGVVAWREWNRAGREWPGEGGDVLERSRFVAVLGLLGSALFALAILAQWVAVIVLHPGMGICGLVGGSCP